MGHLMQTAHRSQAGLEPWSLSRICARLRTFEQALELGLQRYHCMGKSTCTLYDFNFSLLCTTATSMQACCGGTELRRLQAGCMGPAALKRSCQQYCLSFADSLGTLWTL